MGISKNGGCPKVTCQWNHDDKQWGLGVYPIFRETHMNVCETSAPWGVCGETETNVGGDCSLEDVGNPQGNLWRFSQVLFGSPVGTCWDLDVCRSPKICCGGSWNRCQGESPCWQDYLKALLMLPAVIQARSWTDFLLLGLAKGSRGARISQFSTLQEMQQWSKKQVVQEWNNHFSILKSPYFPHFSPIFPHFFPFFPIFSVVNPHEHLIFKAALMACHRGPRMAWFGPFWMRTKQLRWCPGAETLGVHEILLDFKVLYINILSLYIKNIYIYVLYIYDSGTVEC